MVLRVVTVVTKKWKIFKITVLHALQQLLCFVLLSRQLVTISLWRLPNLALRVALGVKTLGKDYTFKLVAFNVNVIAASNAPQITKMQEALLLFLCQTTPRQEVRHFWLTI